MTNKIPRPKDLIKSLDGEVIGLYITIANIKLYASPAYVETRSDNVTFSIEGAYGSTLKLTVKPQSIDEVSITKQKATVSVTFDTRPGMITSSSPR